MRTITIPGDVLKRAHLDSGEPGARLEYVVCVDWPELRLTEDQVIANAIARANDREPPYPDHSIFSVTLERFI